MSSGEVHETKLSVSTCEKIALRFQEMGKTSIKAQTDSGGWNFYSELLSHEIGPSVRLKNSTFD